MSSGVAVDSDGVIYVADRLNNWYRFDLEVIVTV